MEAKSHRIEMRIDSSLDLIGLVLVISEKIGQMIGLDEDHRFHLNLAVDEAVTNAIKHGNAFDAAKNVSVHFIFDDEQIEVAVLDEGKCFDTDKIPDPTQPEGLLRANGRGIFLIKTFMDEVDFRCNTNKGMQVCMRKNIST